MIGALGVKAFRVADDQPSDAPVASSHGNVHLVQGHVSASDLGADGLDAVFNGPIEVEPSDNPSDEDQERGKDHKPNEDSNYDSHARASCSCRGTPGS